MTNMIDGVSVINIINLFEKDLAEDYLKRLFKLVIEERESISRAYDEIQDTLHHDCEPEWVIYTHQAAQVACQYAFDPNVASEFQSMGGLGVCTDLNDVYVKIAACVAIVKAQSALDDACHKFESSTEYLAFLQEQRDIEDAEDTALLHERHNEGSVSLDAVLDRMSNT